MSKSSFNSLLNKSSFSEHDVELLKEIVAENPYFQTARYILARAAKQLKDNNSKIYTNFALVYSSDRSVFKSYMLGELDHEIKEINSPDIHSSTAIPLHKKQAPVKILTDDFPSRSLDDLEMERIYREIKQNIEEIELNKAKFFENFDSMPEAKKISGKRVTPTPAKSTAGKKKEVVKKEPENKNRTSSAKKTHTKKNPDHSDEYGGIQHQLIEELENKKEVERLGELQRQQIRIIDDFLKNPIELKDADNIKTTEPVKDLSLHSVESREDIISENLANIMLRQGKKDKAVEILKKLIWKFPQKKAYFASRIEEIKNS